MISKAKLLWTNPNPNKQFSGQTINLDLSKYTGVIVEFNRTDSVLKLVSRVLLLKSDNKTSIKLGEEFGAGWTDKETYASFSRLFAMTETSVIFNNGASQTAMNNGLVIPTKIYGVNINLI